MAKVSSGSSATIIDSSNIGYQLLKKQGWKEGTGLGLSEQGRLEPLQAIVKKNKRGLGAEKRQKPPNSDPKEKTNEENTSKKAKALAKRMRKMQESEQRLQEREFERAFRTEFWPDNV